MTTYDDHDTYQAGDSWDYNQEMSELFEKKFERGPVSNRPSASNAPDNSVWLATDQNLIYENDPTNGWTVTGHGSSSDKVPDGYFESIETEESVEVTQDDTVTYGRNHGTTVQGDNVAIGVGSAALEDVNSTVTGNDPRSVAVGFQAAQNDEQFGTVAVGYRAARNNTSRESVFVGYGGGENSTGSQYNVGVGHNVLKNNTGQSVVAAGWLTARDNTGDRVTAVGTIAGYQNDGDDVAALGYSAVQLNTGNDVTAFGWYCAAENTGSRTTVIGAEAGRGSGLSDSSTMGDDNIGIGQKAIKDNQASGLIAIGQDAGINAQTDDQLIITQRDGTRRMVMDLTTGDLNISGELTENASL